MNAQTILAADLRRKLALADTMLKTCNSLSHFHSPQLACDIDNVKYALGAVVQEYAALLRAFSAMQTGAEHAIHS
jgi:hypothetical protein